MISGQQISLFSYMSSEYAEDLEQKNEALRKHAREKRNWENAFQKWSNEQAQDGTDSRGVCGYGSMCEWCEDNTYGRPCVRALNAMLREKMQQIDYSKRDFEAIWYKGSM